MKGAIDVPRFCRKRMNKIDEGLAYIRKVI